MDTEEYHQLVFEHLRFAEGLAKRFHREYHHSLLDYDDVLSAAYTGLCAAARRYRSCGGAKFESFSYMRIRGAMLDLIRKNSTPFSSRRHVRVEREKMSQPCAFDVDNTAANSFIQIAERIIDELGISLHSISSTGEVELTYLNESTPEECSNASALNRYISNCLDQLPERERELITCKYFQDQSFPEMSVAFNDVRSSWLCRIHTRALNRLRTIIREEDAAEWLSGSV